MSMNPQVLQRYQQLVAQGVPTMQAYATAQHEAETNLTPQPQLPSFGSLAGGIVGPAANAIGNALPTLPGLGGPSAPPAGGPSAGPAAGPPGGGPQQPPMNSPASGQANPPSPGGGSRGGGNDKTASDYAPSLSPAKPSPDTSHSSDATNGPNQPADAPAQASDPNQAGPQAGNSAYPGTTPSEVNTQFYELGANDTPATLAQRIFKGGGAGSGIPGFGGQNFYDERVTGSPWGQFLASRYTPEVQSDLTLGRLAGGDDSADSNMNMARSVLQNVANGGGAPAGGGMAALKSMASNLSNFDPNNTTGMSQSQSSTLRQLYNDPSSQAQTILGQMQGQTGGWGMNFLRNQLANQAQLSYNNPSQNPMNTFASRVLPMIGMGS